MILCHQISGKRMTVYSNPDHYSCDASSKLRKISSSINHKKLQNVVARMLPSKNLLHHTSLPPFHSKLVVYTDRNNQGILSPHSNHSITLIYIRYDQSSVTCDLKEISIINPKEHWAKQKTNFPRCNIIKWCGKPWYISLPSYRYKLPSLIIKLP